MRKRTEFLKSKKNILNYIYVQVFLVKWIENVVEISQLQKGFK